MLHPPAIPTRLCFACALLIGCSSTPDLTDRPAASLASKTTRLQALTKRALAERRGEQIDELVVRREQVDSAGDAHLELEARRRGYRVVGAGIIRHQRADGSDETTSGVDTRGLRFDDTPPAIDAGRAETIASAALASEHARVRRVASELFYDLDKDTYRLVYKVDVLLDVRDTGRIEWQVRVDPRDGRVLRREDFTQRDSGVGRGYWYGTEPIETKYVTSPSGGGKYYLQDWTRPATGQHIDTLSWFDATTVATTPLPFTDADNTWGNDAFVPYSTSAFSDPATGPFSPYGQTVAVDAHVAAAQAWDLYAVVFGYRGPYNDGSAFTNVVHVIPTDAYPAPFYSVAERTMYINVAESSCVHLANFQVVGHELAHGFFMALKMPTANGEGGGLNEANSDIMGKLTDMLGLTARGLSGPGPYPSANVTPVSPPTLPLTWSDWMVRGGGCGLDRYMNKPSLDGHSPDAWSADVDSLDAHFASGPINRMFYFLVAGVSPGESAYLSSLTGIGVPKAADIYFRGVVNWLPHAYPKFADLRAALEKAAEPDMDAKKAVQDAFAAVNVGPPADRQGPTITNPTRVSAPGQPIGATVIDPSGVKLVRYGIVSGNPPRTGPLATAYAPPWTITVPAGTPTGTYTLETCADDQLDNRSCITSSLYIDTAAPVIRQFEVTNPWAPAAKTVHVVAADGNLARVAISLDGVPAWQAVATKLYPLAPKLDATPSIALPDGLSEGTHTLTAVATDAVGLRATASTSFLWDLTSPDVCDFNVEPRTVFAPSDGSNGEARDQLSGIGIVSFTFDGADYGDNSLNAAPGQLILSGLHWDNQSVGQHTLKMTCFDRFGRAASQTKAITVSAPPTGAISALSQSNSGGHFASYHVHASDGDGLQQVSSDVLCSLSGDHLVDTTFSGTPTTYDKTFTVGGLVVGEQCTIYLGATDRYKIAMPLQQVNFTVTDPVVIYNEVERNDTTPNLLPATVRQINGNYNGAWVALFMLYRDADNFKITVPAGKSITARTGFTCSGSVLEVSRWNPAIQNWEDGAALVNLDGSATATRPPWSATTSMDVQISVYYDFYYGGSPVPNEPNGCVNSAYSIFLTVQ